MEFWVQTLFNLIREDSGFLIHLPSLYRISELISKIDPIPTTTLPNIEKNGNCNFYCSETQIRFSILIVLVETVRELKNKESKSKLKNRNPSSKSKSEDEEEKQEKGTNQSIPMLFTSLKNDKN